MTKVIQIEKRKRGFLGRLFLLLFLGLNELRALALFVWLGANVDNLGKLTNYVEKGVHALGTTLGVGMIL